MKAYLAIKYHEDQSNKKSIEALSSMLEGVGIETLVMARDFEKWGEVKNVEPDVLMAHTFAMINQVDFAIVEFSEKGVGIGIEAGYALAQRKPIIVIAKDGSEVSSTLQGIAKKVFFYNNPQDLEENFKKLINQNQGVAFVLMRPDKTFLMQLRDSKSKRFKNMWCFPGGSCDPGEEYSDTLIREVKEEYDLDIKKEDCQLLMKRVMDKMYVFLCKIRFDQEPILKEGADMKWMTLDEVKKLTIGFNQSDIVEKLQTII